MSSINRATKADRGARLASPAAQTQTISLRLKGLSDTSVLVRIPWPRSPAAALRAFAGQVRRRTTAVACEPVVSVLTEVAKQLSPAAA